MPALQRRGPAIHDKSSSKHAKLYKNKPMYIPEYTIEHMRSGWDNLISVFGQLMNKRFCRKL